MKVEFRLLQVVLSSVSGDRVTVALVHWDGAQLRVASSPTAFTAVDASHRDGIRAAVEDIVRRANRRAREIEKQGELDVGLAHAFPVREGMGAALYWTPVSYCETSDPGAHFLELRREIRLDREPSHRTTRVTERKVFDGLVSLGEELKRESTAWVRTSHEVSYKMKYEVPLSWKNGCWHHAVPLSLDVLDEHAIDDEIRRMYGLVDLSLPEADVAVFVAAMPSSRSTSAHAERDLKMLRLMLKSKRAVDLVIPHRQGRTLNLEPIARRVREDLGSH